MSEHQFDYSGLVDEFRGHSTEWVIAERDRVVAEQRRLRVRELALVRVLDERGKVDDTLAAADGVSVRSVREMVATARALEDLPEIASVAARGGLSGDQLTQVVKVAEPADDHRWAAEAGSWSPADLAQEARRKRKPTMEDAAARRAARELWIWDRHDAGMTDGRFSLADVDGVFVGAVFDHMVDRMTPAKGAPREPRHHRMADALVELCRSYAHVQAVSGPAPRLIVQVPLDGPATVAGIPLPDAMVQRLRAEAKVEPVLVDAAGEPVVVGKVESVLSEKTKRVVLAAVCTTHHAQLAPQGARLPLGNPNHPAGLSLIHRDDLPALAQLAAERARAGPTAA